MEAAIRINEVMVENDGGHADEDGDFSDWIELYNPGNQPVDLAGWSLTDQPDHSGRWVFPSVVLRARSYLVVYASGKNRSAPRLHTHFKLSLDSRYLALFDAGGRQVAQAYGNRLPKQRPNVSFGTGVVSSGRVLFPEGGWVRYRVPSDASQENSWMDPDLDDSEWSAGSLGLGFQEPRPPHMRVDVNDRDNNLPANTQSGFDVFLMGADTTTPVSRTFGAHTMTLSRGNGASSFDDRYRTTPSNSGAFTEQGLLRDFIFAADTISGRGLDVALSGFAPGEVYRVRIWSFDTSSGGNRVSDWYANSQLVRENYSFDGRVMPVDNNQYAFAFETRANAQGEILLAGRRDSESRDTAGASSFGVFLNGLQVDAVSYGNPLRTDVSGPMKGLNSSIYVRIPFEVESVDEFTEARLRIRYNDGFVAYLNGEPLIARNAPATVGWNSAAASARLTSETLEPEEIWIPRAMLRSGRNLLALQGLNAGANDGSFLLEAEVHGVHLTELSHRYFTEATPGAENGEGYLGLLPKPEVSMPRGYYHSPFQVALSASPGAAIHFTLDGSAPSASQGMVYTGPVAVNGTTLLRAVSVRPGWIASEPVTHSYLFFQDILSQPAAPAGYPGTWQGNYPGDYGMDPEIVSHPVYGPTLVQDLQSLPVISIVTDHDSLWGPVRGIYPQATQSGDAWEREASVEWILPGNRTAFQVNCGLRMQGNASRDNARTPKHSFRLLFKSRYGTGQLDHALFAGSPVRRFDNLVLRAFFTDSWGTRYSPADGVNPVGARYRPEDSLYLRDVWMKDTQREMGWLSGHGQYAHLFVNGLYWGLYNPTERLDASFFSEHAGGAKEEWDVLRDFTEVLDGDNAAWNEMMALVNAGIATEEQFQAIAQRVDIENLIDYMLLHFFGEAEDWPHHNWYAARRRASGDFPGGKWMFLTWDQEIVLDQQVTRNRLGVNNDNTPARIYSQLRNYPEFRRMFGDRAHRHLLHGGALSPAKNAARLQRRALEIEQAVVAESARWGDARKSVTGTTFTRDEYWRPELDRLYTNHFQAMPAVTIARLREAQLYPLTGAPLLSQHGGEVPSGYSLTLSHTNLAGAVYYTLDGSDPRVYGTGTVASAARLYSGPIVINAATRVRARVFTGLEWSALTEAVFYLQQDFSKLRLTEVMYHPVEGSQEFIELKNTGTAALDLSGLRFTRGVEFTFSLGTQLPAGAFLLLVRDAAAFQQRYGSIPVHGTYAGQLDNGGELLRLQHPLGTVLMELEYGDQPPWPLAADGHGFSLVPAAPGAAHVNAAPGWRASSAMGGSPGADDPAPALPVILVNEVLSASPTTDQDRIELHNPGGTEASMGGWFLTDDFGNPKKYRIPPGTTLPAGGYGVFLESQFSQPSGGLPGFSLSARGEQVAIFSANEAGDLTGYSHGFEFGGAETGVSFGRHATSDGAVHYPRQEQASFGSQNGLPRVGPVVLSEIHYLPGAGSAEFVEIQNISRRTVSLFHPTFATNTWRIEGLEVTLPQNLLLAPGELLLVVAGDPQFFRSRHGIDPGIRILGGMQGTLQDDGERLRLVRPEISPSGAWFDITMDEVRYDDAAPWPQNLAAGGFSLQRRELHRFGSEPANWEAAAPTPGRSPNYDRDGDGLPDAWESLHQTDPATPDADADPDQDGLTNYQEFLAGTDPQDAASRLELQIDPAGPVLRFLAKAEVPYTLEFLEDFDAQWEVLISFPAASTDLIREVTDPAPEAHQRFYRLRVP